MTFNINSDTDKLALQQEINNDPENLGYDPLNPELGITKGFLNLINAKNETIKINKQTLKTEQLRGLIPFEVHKLLGADEKDYINFISGAKDGEIILTDNIVKVLADKDNSATRANTLWNSIDKKTMGDKVEQEITTIGSRAEELFGINTRLTKDDYFAAVRHVPKIIK